MDIYAQSGALTVDGLQRTELAQPAIDPLEKKRRWEDDDYIYEWDSQHGRVEKYNKRGKHLGEFDPDTGKQTKPPNPDRYIEP